jgi:hypothetical protein
VRVWQEERPGPILLGRGDRWDTPHPEATAALRHNADATDNGSEPTATGLDEDGEPSGD